MPTWPVLSRALSQPHPGDGARLTAWTAAGLRPGASPLPEKRGASCVPSHFAGGPHAWGWNPRRPALFVHQRDRGWSVDCTASRFITLPSSQVTVSGSSCDTRAETRGWENLAPHLPCDGTGATSPTSPTSPMEFCRPCSTNRLQGRTYFPQSGCQQRLRVGDGIKG